MPEPTPPMGTYEEIAVWWRDRYRAAVDHAPRPVLANELRRLAVALNGPAYIDRARCTEIAGSLRTVAAILDGEPAT